MIYKNIDINMTKSEIESLELIKEEELKIMDKIHNICLKNKIQYGLMWGSLIGGLRHNDFIPWDDDIDIAMTSSEFLKLKRLIDSNELLLIDHKTKKWHLTINKVFINNATIKKSNDFEQTPFVDIFIINKAPKSKTKINKILKKMRFYWNSAHPLARILLAWVPFWKTNIKNKIDNIIYQNDKLLTEKDYDEVYFPCDPYGFKNKLIPRTYNKELFKSVELIKFGKRKYFIFTGSKSFLEKWCPDYLILPTFSQRRSSHFFNKKNKGKNNDKN